MIKLFSECTDQSEKYQKLIELGGQLPKLPPILKTTDRVVKGCQSTVYFHSKLNEGALIFSAESDALISAGLAALLINVYNGESPETVLKCPPDYLKTIGLNKSLTPSRINGLYSIHLKMKQEALAQLIAT